MTKRIIYLMFVSTIYIPASLLAQIPSGYYDTANGLTGDNLKAALHDIIKGHTTYPYSSSSGTDVWDIIKDADEDPNDNTKVIGLYSRFSMDAAAEYDNGNGWNREHVWAKSRGDFGTSQGPGTDCHHIAVEDISTNSARSNRNFDEAPDLYTDSGGNYSGATTARTSSVDWTWEPPAEVKGDVARMILYMATRYEGDNGEPDLELTETHYDNTSKLPYHSKLSVLLQWHQDDPVSDRERDRNDVIYGYQNNRNPFIDHPEYVCEIFDCGTSSSTSDLIISEYVEGSSNNKAIELANFTGSSVDLSDYSIKKQTNGAGSWSSGITLSGTLSDGDVYVIANSSSSSSITSVADYTGSNSELSFNGNDPIGLFKSGVLLDIVGTFNGGSSNFAKDVTLVRKEENTEANTTYTSSEWDSYSQNTFSYLGSHTMSGGSDTEAPSVPFGLSATNTTETGTDLSWTASTDNVGVTSYDVYKDGNLLGSTTGATSYSASGLSASSTYSFTIKAKDDAGNESAASSSLNVTTASIYSDLVISEYVEGSSNNKAIEIANNTGSSVDLSDYVIKKQTNGAGSWSSGLSLSGNLADGAVYIIANSSASSSVTSVANYTGSNSELSFNGNDPIGLFKSGSLIDIVGTFNGGSSYFAKDVTIRRKNSLNGPNTTYTTSEWDSFSQDTFSGLGSHTARNGKKFDNNPILNENRDLKSEISLFPNPSNGIFTIKLVNQEHTPVVIRIYDLQGKEINHIQENNSEDMFEKKIYLQNARKGLYFVMIEGTGILQTKKFIIR